MDNQQRPTVYCMKLYSMLCVILDGMRIWGRVDTCIYMAEFLHCSPVSQNCYLATPQYKIKSLKLKKSVCSFFMDLGFQLL